MVIAVPTGIKIWATVRVYAKLLPLEVQLKTNSKEELTEGLSAYSDVVMLGGQEPALKRILRTQAGAMNNCRSKINFEAIGCLRMRLNYQNSSNFGSYHAYLWLQLLHRYLGPLKVKIYFKGISKTETLLIAFRTGYKRVSLFINSRVAYATGEVSASDFFRKGDGRGSVVPNLQIGKGPKHFAKLGFIPNQTRSYVTRSGMKSLAPVQEQPDTPKGLKIIAKHWLTNYQSPQRVYYDLRGRLKQESIWFAAYLKLNNKKGYNTQGPEVDIIDSLTKRRILELREAVLKNEFS
jgi:hypothetical protein